MMGKKLDDTTGDILLMIVDNRETYDMLGKKLDDTTGDIILMNVDN